MYWEQVLKEVLNKDNAAYPCVFTSLKKPPEEEKVLKTIARPSKSDELRIALGDSKPGVYFTRRESQCMALLLEGNTMKESGAKLQLSPRTIEYYVKNMKIKTKARTRSELIRLVLNSDFIANAKKLGFATS